MFDITLIFIIVILILSVIIHELAHGYVAYSLGDPTAKYAGRLTLNPIKHIDLFGSIILPGILILSSLFGGSAIIFGWAKPVPVNPYNFRDQKWGQLKVALAGPLSNMLVALCFGLAMRFIPLPSSLSLMFSIIVQLNIVLAIFNLLPIPPLDGSWVLFQFLPDQFEGVKVFLQQYGMFILLFLLLFGGLYWLTYVEGLLFGLFTGVGV